MQLVLFNPQIGPYQVLPFRARVDLGAMAMKGCFTFPKAPASLEPHHQVVQCHILDFHWRGKGLTSQQRCSRCILHPPSSDWARIQKEKTICKNSLASFCNMKYVNVISKFSYVFVHNIIYYSIYIMCCYYITSLCSISYSICFTYLTLSYVCMYVCMYARAHTHTHTYKHILWHTIEFYDISTIIDY